MCTLYLHVQKIAFPGLLAGNIYFNKLILVFEEKINEVKRKILMFKKLSKMLLCLDFFSCQKIHFWMCWL